MIAKEKYLSYKIGDRVMLRNESKQYQTYVPARTVFTIISFPPKTLLSVKGDKYKYYIYGETDDKREIRAFISEVTKVK